MNKQKQIYNKENGKILIVSFIENPVVKLY